MKNNKDTFQGIDRLPLSQKEIDVLKKGSAHRSGCWEIDWGPEPMSAWNKNIKDQLSLVLVAHQESYSVIEMYTSALNAEGRDISAFVNAIKKQFVLPETILVCDKVLGDELVPLAEALGCKIEKTRFKAIPQIRRDMRRFMS